VKRELLGKREAWHYTQFKPSNRIKYGNSLNKNVYDGGVLGVRQLTELLGCAALYTAASGFTGSGSFSEGSPRHAISLLSFP